MGAFLIILYINHASAATTAGVESKMAMATINTLSNGKACDWTREKTTASHWTEVFAGYGKLIFDPEKGIQIQPRPPESPGVSHAGLVLLKKTVLQPVRNFATAFEFRVKEQLRKQNPNPWEALWFLFNFQSSRDPKAKTTNYFIFKTTGLELGSAFGTDGQNFHLTTQNPTLRIGQSYKVVVFKKDRLIEVEIDGERVMEHQLHSDNRTFFDQPGSIGFYSEDANVSISDIRYCSLEN